MKHLVLAAATLMTSASAFAFLPEPDPFIATDCGPVGATSQPVLRSMIREVCFGDIEREPGAPIQAAVQFRLTSGLNRTFKIARTEKLSETSVAGRSLAKLILVDDDGIQTTMNVIRGPKGIVESAEGEVRGAPYVVPRFDSNQPVF